MSIEEFEAKTKAIADRLGANEAAVVLAWENVIVYSGFAADDCSQECLDCFEASLEGQSA